VTLNKFHTEHPHVFGATAQIFTHGRTGVWDLCTPAVLFLLYSNVLPAQSCYLCVYQRTSRQATSVVIDRFRDHHVVHHRELTSSRASSWEKVTEIQNRCAARQRGICLQEVANNWISV